MLSSRRHFLKNAALSAVALRFSRAAVRFPKIPRERLSVTSYPFRAYIDSPTNDGRNPALPGMDLKQFPAFVVEKFGIHNINPLIAHCSSTDSAYLESFRRAVSDAGSHVVDLGLPGKAFSSSDRAEREDAVTAGSKWVDMAAIIGSPSVRQHLHGRKGDKPDVGLAAQSLGKLAEYGAKRGVVINLENDNAVWEDPFFIVDVTRQVGSPYLRSLPDFGNSLIAHDSAYNRRAVAAMLKYAFNICHVKGVVEADSGRAAAVDLKSMFALAKESSFQGYFSMEFETREGDPVKGTQQLAAQTLRYLSEES